MSGTPDVPVEGRVLPQPDAVSAPFWEATTRDELLVQRCPACGAHQFYPRPFCTTCGGTPEWVVASGRGTVHTFTVVRQNRTPPFDAMGAYPVAVVELDEGVRMMTNLVGVDPDDVHVGMPVEVHFVAAEDLKLPFFRPIGG